MNGRSTSVNRRTGEKSINPDPRILPLLRQNTCQPAAHCCEPDELIHTCFLVGVVHLDEHDARLPAVPFRDKV